MSDETPVSDSGPSTAPAPPLPRRSKRRLAAGLLVAFVGMLVIALVTVGAGLWWAVRSDSGTARLLPWLPYVAIDGARGALLGDFGARRLVITLPGGRGTIVLHDVAWRGLQLSRSPVTGQWVRVAADELSASRADVNLAPSSGPSTRPALPTDLRLPLEVQLGALKLGELRVGDATLLRDLSTRLSLSDEKGAQHRIESLSLTYDRLRVQGSARIGTAAPFPLAVQAEVAQAAEAAVAPSLPASAASSAAPAALAWRATASLAGPLESPVLTATVRARADATRPEQSLDARATLRPFAPWPLGELQARTQALDLSALHSAAPVTSLTGAAQAETSAIDRPGAVGLHLTNAEAGRWDVGRLPLRSVTLALRGRPDDPRALELASLQADLGTQRDPAGRLSGQGRWTPKQAELDLKLDALTPSLLDARAPSIRLDGPISLRAAGLDASPTIEVNAKLSGPLTSPLGDGPGPRVPAQLSLDGLLSAARIELRELKASAGGATARVSGTATQAGPQSPWLLKGALALVDFDPQPWWPGREASPWRQGPHRLNASGDIDLSLTMSSNAKDLWQHLAGLRGRADLTVANSRLAGVPIGGSVALRSPDGHALTGQAKLDADGNALTADARLALGSDGAGDRLDATLAAPALARLTPLWRLVQGDPQAVLDGKANAKVGVTGRWPTLATRGSVQADGLRAGAASVQKAEATWQLDLARDGPLELQAAITQAALKGAAAPQTLDSARLSVKGTMRDHRLDLRAETRALPPGWTELMVAAPPPAATASAASASRSLALLQAQGGLIRAAQAAPGGSPLQFDGWRGSVQQIELRPTAAPSAPWLRARDVAFAAQWGEAASLNVQPGRAEVLGGAVTWSRIAWQAATGTQAARIEAQAQIEPLRIAPLLARAQPGFGWGGDLHVGGRIDVRSAPTLEADIVIERTRGDLTVTDEAGTQSLGLSDLRLGLVAKDGVWSFTQALAGSTIGVGAGAAVVRTRPDAIWPPADAPLEGVFELRVANLGTWGTWVPTGWRLSGALNAAATLGGRFGAPEYRGEVKGAGLGVRNFLQGVDVREGDLSLALQGTSARVERFSAKAGQGTVQLAGGASLGDAPKADLTLTAERFQLLGRVDRRIVASGRARLQLDRENLALDGKFTVDEGLVDVTRSEAPSLSADVDVVRRSTPSPQAIEAARTAQAATPPVKARQVALDLQVDLGRNLRLRGHGLDTGLRGDLRLTAPQNQLAVNGTITTDRGTYNAYGQKLTIDRGLLAFSGAIESPRLDIEATRPGLDIRVGVIVTGTALNPRVRLFSVPDMTEIDKLSWLVLGRASDGLGRTDTALLQRAALALLAGDGPGLTDQFTKAIGLDEISLRQSDGDVRDTVITLGKQLSQRWYVGYERGLNATAGTWQLIYRAGRRFTLRAQSGLDNSVDAIWSWRWD